MLLQTGIFKAAYRGIIDVRPDYVVQVREDVLREEDDLMLKYSLQSLHNSELRVPTRTEGKPSNIALEWRYHFLGNEPTSALR